MSILLLQGLWISSSPSPLDSCALLQVAAALALGTAWSRSNEKPHGKVSLSQDSVEACKVVKERRLAW